MRYSRNPLPLCSHRGVPSLLLAIALLLMSCTAGLTQPDDTEAASIYAAVIRQIYTADDTFGGTLQPPRLYIVGTTDDSAGNPSNDEGSTTLISPAVRQDITRQLADLPTEIVWVESPTEVERDPDSGSIPGDGAIITLGNINPQEPDVVHLPASIYVASLAAGGQTYVLEKRDGVWTITGNTGVQWIS